MTLFSLHNGLLNNRLKCAWGSTGRNLLVKKKSKVKQFGRVA